MNLDNKPWYEIEEGFIYVFSTWEFQVKVGIAAEPTSYQSIWYLSYAGVQLAVFRCITTTKLSYFAFDMENPKKEIISIVRHWVSEYLIVLCKWFISGEYT